MLFADVSNIYKGCNHWKRLRHSAPKDTSKLFRCYSNSITLHRTKTFLCTKGGSALCWNCRPRSYLWKWPWGCNPSQSSIHDAKKTIKATALCIHGSVYTILILHLTSAALSNPSGPKRGILVYFLSALIHLMVHFCNDSLNLLHMGFSFMPSQF